MDLSLSEHQRMLAQSARTFMQRRMPKATIVALQNSRTGYQPQTWSTIAELGWLGLLIPSDYGGGGASGPVQVGPVAPRRNVRARGGSGPPAA